MNFNDKEKLGDLIQEKISKSGFLVHKVQSNRYDIIKLIDGVSDPNETDYNLKYDVIASIDLNGLSDGKFYLICKKLPIDDITFKYLDDMENAIKHIKEWSEYDSKI